MGKNKRDAAADLEICQAATPGPWKWEDGEGTEMGRYVGGCGKIICDFGDGEPYYPTEGNVPDWNDDLFITESRTALPHWIERAQTAEKEVERLRAENASVVALAGAGYEKLIAALQTIADETDDHWARDCAEEALKSILPT